MTVYGMLSPHSKKSPSTGTLTVTVGAVLPTVIWIVRDCDLPVESVTVSRAV